MALSLLAANGNFIQIGEPRWGMRSDGFDRLTIAYQGYKDNLASFLSGLQKWESSPIDGRMFLEDYDSDHHSRQPTVEVKYIGCKGGVLPEPLSDNNEGVHEATYTSSDGLLTVRITYIAPISSKRTITIAKPAGSIGAITPADAKGVWFTWAYTGEGGFAFLATSIEQVITNYFSQRIVTLQNTREVVPNKYFDNIETKQALLFSNEA